MSVKFITGAAMGWEDGKNGQIWQQLVATLMGTRAAPNIADIFMSFNDKEIILELRDT